MAAISILWRRIDTPGHDGCRLEGSDAGWRLDGTAVFRVGEASAQLTYRVVCDSAWRTQNGQVRATNLLQFRRLNLVEGQTADVPVAWLDVSGGSLSLLRQRYERRTKTTYWYEAPRFDYAALLEVTPDAFVRRYPGLWEMEP